MQQKSISYVFFFYCNYAQTDHNKLSKHYITGAFILKLRCSISCTPLARAVLSYKCIASMNNIFGGQSDYAVSESTLTENYQMLIILFEIEFGPLIKSKIPGLIFFFFLLSKPLFVLIKTHNSFNNIHFCLNI